MNDGEGSAFPIQVSRQELLLFLGCFIVIGRIKTHVIFMPKEFSGNYFTTRGSFGGLT